MPLKPLHDKALERRVEKLENQVDTILELMDLQSDLVSAQLTGDIEVVKIKFAELKKKREI